MVALEQTENDIDVVLIQHLKHCVQSVACPAQPILFKWYNQLPIILLHAMQCFR